MKYQFEKEGPKLPHTIWIVVAMQGDDPDIKVLGAGTSFEAAEVGLERVLRELYRGSHEGKFDEEDFNENYIDEWFIDEPVEVPVVHFSKFSDEVREA